MYYTIHWAINDGNHGNCLYVTLSLEMPLFLEQFKNNMDKYRCIQYNLSQWWIQDLVEGAWRESDNA